MIEPNVWDVIPEPYSSPHGLHVPTYPGFIDFGQNIGSYFLFECFYLRCLE